MSAHTQKIQDADASPADSRRAVTHLFGEYERARAETEAAERRLARFAETIYVVLAGLPQKEKEELTKRFEDIRSGNQGRTGDVNSNVIYLFRKEPNRAWSVPEVQEELRRAGTGSDSKAVANAIAYLAKTGRLTRISRGQYMFAELGIGIEFDGRNDGTQRLCEHDD